MLDSRCFVEVPNASRHRAERARAERARAEADCDVETALGNYHYYPEAGHRAWPGGPTNA